jgi:hypothetical protein
MAKRTFKTKPTGRASTYTPQIAQQIVDRISQGEPLQQICRDGGFPKWRTVYKWIDSREDFRAAIARARDLGYDAIAEGLRDVARGKEGSSGDVMRDKLIVETDLKLLSKWSPKKYGDSVGLKLTDGATGGEYALTEILIGIRQETRPAAPAQRPAVQPAQIVEAEK